MGGGGKTLLGEQRFQRFKELLLVLLYGHQVIAALLIEDLACMRHLGMSRIAEHDLAHQVQLGQLLAPGRDFITALGHQRRT